MFKMFPGIDNWPNLYWVSIHLFGCYCSLLILAKFGGYGVPEPQLCVATKGGHPC